MSDHAMSDSSECTGTCGTCAQDGCAERTEAPAQTCGGNQDQAALKNRMAKIKHKIIVLSGKGGVGKSTVAVNLATALAMEGRDVGLLDVDIHGPSVPTMLGRFEAPVQNTATGIKPVSVDSMKVMSIGFLLQDRDDAVIWRGPMKMGVIQQFLQDVEWGELDYLIIDSPPGTGDEPLSVCQLIDNPTGAVVVTTPQEVAAADVRKSLNFCNQLGIPVLGLVENMSGFVCPKCGEVTEIFKVGGGQRLADTFQVPLLGCIPIDPSVGAACDDGTPFIYHHANSPAAKAFAGVVAPILRLTETKKTKSQTAASTKENTMRIAVPVAEGKLAMHFGHCATFALVDVDTENKTVLGREDVPAPPHQPGLLPPWLAERNVNLVIAGGMGQRAQALFAEHGITVLVGAPAETPEDVATQYLAGTLQTGANVCDH